MAITRDDVIAWWDLQREDVTGSVYDDHGGYDGSVAGSYSLVNDTPLKNGIGAFSFDGASGYIGVPDSNDFDTQNFSVAAWIKTTNGTDQLGVISKWYDGNIRQWMLRINQESGVGANDGFIEWFVGNSSTLNDAQYDAGTTLYDGNWHHLVGTYDGTNLELFLDGSSVDTAVFSNTVGANNADIHIASISNSGPSAFFDGEINSAQYFGKALTSDDVGSLYNAGDGVTYRGFFDLEESLLAYYKLDGNENNAVSGSYNLESSGVIGSDSKLVIGSAYTFDSGTTSYLTEGDIGTTIGSLQPTRPYSMSAWFKTNSVSNSAIISMSNPNSIASRDTIYIEDTVGSLVIADTSDINTYITSNNSSVTDGNIHHVVGVFLPSTSKLYLDGSFVGSTSASTDLDKNKFYVGAFNTNGITQYLYEGSIDEVAVYDRELSPGEVRRLYSFGAGLRYEDLDNETFLIDGVRASWLMNDTADDAKNNTYNGSLSGASSYTTGKINQGVDLPGGDNDYFETNLLIDTGQWTVGGWFKFDTLASPNRGLFTTMVNDASRDGLRVYTRDSPDEDIGAQIAQADSFTTLAGPGITTDTWYCAGLGYDGGSVVLYVDDIEEDASAGNYDVDQSLRVGEYYHGFNGNEMNGQIDNVIVWSRKLSITEWNAFYNNGLGVELPVSIEPLTGSDTKVSDANIEHVYRHGVGAPDATASTAGTQITFAPVGSYMLSNVVLKCRGDDPLDTTLKLTYNGTDTSTINIGNETDDFAWYSFPFSSPVFISGSPQSISITSVNGSNYLISYGGPDNTGWSTRIS